MDKQEILSLCNNLYEEAFDAKAARKILQQFRENVSNYREEFNCSPAFYGVVHQTLVQNMLMLLSKLYDWNRNSLTLRTALAETENINISDLDDHVSEMYSFNHHRFQHQLRPVEEPFYQKQVEDQKKLLEIFGYEYTHTTVDFELSEMHDLFQKRFQDLQDRDIISNLINRRNTIYAHNDRKTNFDFDKVSDDYPLTMGDIDLLIDFAMDFLVFYIEILSGTYKAVEYINIDDWANTLQMVRIGMKYEEAYIEEQLNEEWSGGSL